MGLYSLKSIYEVLSTTTFYTDRKEYIFLKTSKENYTAIMQDLSSCTDEYIQVINDKDELTVLAPTAVWQQYCGDKYELLDSVKPVALITCSVTKPTVTGYLFILLTTISSHNISVFVQGAFTTDHIFVDYENLDKTLALLNQLKGEM